MSAAKILIVDDEKNITEVLQAYLEREDYTVIVAHSGPDALSLACFEKPDILILDLMLPALSGEEVCRQLRRDGSRVPVIMLTAKTGLEDKVYGLAIGADDYVVKPFSPQKVVASVKSLLRRSGPDQYSFLQDKIDSFQPYFRENDLNLKLVLPEETLSASQDPFALHKIMRNLLDNACRYTKPGGTVEVTRSEKPEIDPAAVVPLGQDIPEGSALEEKLKNKFFIKISDTGSGIRKDYPPYIFERFFRADPAR